MPTYPEIQYQVVLWFPDEHKLKYFANDHDELLKGTILQRSTDSGNLVKIGTDGGLLVELLSSSESGVVTTLAGTLANHIEPIVFANTYLTPPFVTITAKYKSGIFTTCRSDNLTLLGFDLCIDEVFGTAIDIAEFSWKAN